FESVLRFPSSELQRTRAFARRLRIRGKLNGDDVVAYARTIAVHPERAQGFEIALAKLANSLTRTTIDRLIRIPFVRSMTGALLTPSAAHQRTAVNLACLDPEDGFAAGNAAALYRRLRCPAKPTKEALLDSL